MSESLELDAAINYIKYKVEAIEKIELLNLRSNNVLRDKYISKLKSDALLFQIYKEINGFKTQREIANIVNTTEMTVSNKIKILLELGLIEPKEVTHNKCIYKHSIAEIAFKLLNI
jgi:predicted transcriptional regulator